jgi:hypothetical protein
MMWSEAAGSHHDDDDDDDDPFFDTSADLNPTPVPSITAITVNEEVVRASARSNSLQCISSISTCSTLDSSEKQKDFIIVPTIYEQYHKVRNELYSNLLNLDHMRTYNPLNKIFFS